MSASLKALPVAIAIGLTPLAGLAAPPETALTKSAAATACASVADPTVCLTKLISATQGGVRLRYDLAILGHPSWIDRAEPTAASLPDYVRQQKRIAAAWLAACKGAAPDAVLADFDHEATAAQRVTYYRWLANGASARHWARPSLKPPSAFFRAVLQRWEKDRPEADAAARLSRMTGLLPTESLDIARAYTAIGDQTDAERVVQIEALPGSAGEMQRLAATGRLDAAAKLAEEVLPEVPTWYRPQKMVMRTYPLGGSSELVQEPVGEPSHGRTLADTFPAIANTTFPLIRQAGEERRPDLIARFAEANLAIPYRADEYMWRVLRDADRQTALQWANRLSAHAKPEEHEDKLALAVFKAWRVLGQDPQAHHLLEAWVAGARAQGATRGKEQQGLHHDYGMDLAAGEMLVWEQRYGEAHTLSSGTDWPQHRIIADVESGRGLGDAMRHLDAAPSEDIRVQAFQECRMEMIKQERFADAYACHKLQWVVTRSDPVRADQEDGWALDLAERAAQQGDVALARQIEHDVLQRWMVRVDRKSLPLTAAISSADDSFRTFSDTVDNRLMGYMITVAQAAAQTVTPEIKCTN
jgi:hypothetical protein